MIQILAVGVLCLIGIGPKYQAATAVRTQIDLQSLVKMDDAKFGDWLSRWETNVLSETSQNYCTKEMGEDMGWLIYPLLKGFYYGYLATGHQIWLGLFVKCTDSWVRRGITEPDGYVGWPKIGAAGANNIDHLDEFYADSLLGEAMVLQYVVRMSGAILQTPPLANKYGAKARAYIALAERVFEKWDKRGAWRHTARAGMVTVELPFGIDKNTGMWTDRYQDRYSTTVGFSHQDNKANLIACWLIAMFDVTHKPIYEERAEKWFRVMKSRMKLTDDGIFQIWNYWEPAGDWDYKAPQLHLWPKHWIGVHPKGGYYEFDVEAVVAAYEHGLVFDRNDISHLIKTAIADQRYWVSLVPYNNAIQKQFEDHNDPDSWGGLSTTPWYLALQARLVQTNTRRRQERAAQTYRHLLLLNHGVYQTAQP
jgi:hypothetical protein